MQTNTHVQCVASVGREEKKYALALFSPKPSINGVIMLSSIVNPAVNATQITTSKPTVKIFLLFLRVLRG